MYGYHIHVKQIRKRQQVQENENSYVGRKICYNDITYSLENIPNGNHSMRKRLWCIFQFKKTKLQIFNEV